MSEATSGEAKRPGRKAETPEQRLQRLERDVVLAKKAVADARQRQLATVGQAVLAEAEENPEFKKQLLQLLQLRVTSKVGKAEIAGVLKDG